MAMRESYDWIAIRGAVIAELARRDWSYDDLAAASGVSASTINNLLNAKVGEPQNKTLVKIAEAFGQQAEWLLMKGLGGGNPGVDEHDVAQRYVRANPVWAQRVIDDEAARNPRVAQLLGR